MSEREVFKGHAALAVRKAKSSAELARALDVSQMTVSNWQRHGVEQVDGRNQALLRKLANYLGYANVEDLFRPPTTPAAPPQPGPAKAVIPVNSVVEKSTQLFDKLLAEADALKPGRQAQGVAELREQVARVKRLCALSGSLEELERAIEWIAGIIGPR